MKNIDLIILIALIVITIFAFRRDEKRYEKFKSLSDTKDRQRFFKRWTVEPFILYGVSSIAILSLIGQIEALNNISNFLVDFGDEILSKSGIKNSNIISGMLKGITMSIVPVLIFGSIIGTYLRTQKENKETKSKDGIKSDEDDFRNLDSLIPRNFKERIWGAILSINAGFSEEIFFRLLAPILIYSVTASALIAVIGSTIWFGLGHYYQGISGIVITLFVGLLLFAVYLTTQNIWITMFVHTILDLNGLVLSPWLKEKHLKQIT